MLKFYHFKKEVLDQTQVFETLFVTFQANTIIFIYENSVARRVQCFRILSFIPKLFDSDV